MQGIVLMGPPGAGKGSIGQYLHSQYAFTHISSGEMFRDEVKDKTEIGQQIESTIQRGGRVDDSLITRLVLKQLEQFIQDNQPFVLDGFPQTSTQLNDLNLFVETHKSLKLRYISVIVDKSTALDRMTNRLSCAKCHAIYNKVFFSDQEDLTCKKCIQPLVSRKSDDRPLAIKRILEFEETTKKMIQNDLKDTDVINGNQPISEIQINIDKLIQ